MSVFIVYFGVVDDKQMVEIGKEITPLFPPKHPRLNTFLHWVPIGISVVGAAAVVVCAATGGLDQVTPSQPEISLRLLSLFRVLPRFYRNCCFRYG